MTVMERIIKELENKRLKRVNLARYIGKSTGQISMWESRNTTPPAELIPKIADFLCVSTDYLLCGNSHDSNADTQIIPYGDRTPKIYEIEKVLESGVVSEDDVELIEFILNKYKK